MVYFEYTPLSFIFLFFYFFFIGRTSSTSSSSSSSFTATSNNDIYISSTSSCGCHSESTCLDPLHIRHYCRTWSCDFLSLWLWSLSLEEQSRRMLSSRGSISRWYVCFPLAVGSLGAFAALGYADSQWQSHRTRIQTTSTAGKSWFAQRKHRKAA